ncbi:MAG TPA: universal stress protein, partial [Azospira sp.]|nr:universal stress protein [Azospira sp.]
PSSFSPPQPSQLHHCPLRHLLLATDFSAAAAQALQRALFLAKAHAAGLTVLHVVPGGRVKAIQFLDMRPEAEVMAQVLAGSREEMEQHLAPWSALPESPRLTSRLEVGTPAQVISRLAGELPADLVIVGGQGERALLGMLLGATVHQVLRQAPCPVLVVKQPPRDDYTRLLLPTDFSPQALAAARIAQAFAPAAAKELLHVFEVPFERQLYFAGARDDTLAFYRQQAESGAQRAMADFTGRLGWPRRPGTRLRQGYAPAEIDRVARDFACDLIVLASRSRSELGAQLLGSVSLHVMEEATCDLLLVPAQGED